MASIAWVDELLDSSEAMALLSLAGNHTATLQHPDVGSVVRYSPRGLSGELLGPTFAYDVLAIFGEGTNGRAVAFRPHHSASDVCIAFRGVRVASSSSPRAREHAQTSPGRSAKPSGPAASADVDDLAALLDLSDGTAAWPAHDARYRLHHGEHFKLTLRTTSNYCTPSLVYAAGKPRQS